MQSKLFHLFLCQIACSCNGHWKERTPMIDFMDFSNEIHVTKAKMMEELGVYRQSYFLFQWRSGDFGNSEVRSTKLCLCMEVFPIKPLCKGDVKL